MPLNDIGPDLVVLLLEIRKNDLFTQVTVLNCFYNCISSWQFFSIDTYFTGCILIMRINKNATAIGGVGKSSKERLPTNTLSHQHRVQRWANFIAGYSVEFVEQCLLGMNNNDDTVIDPFLGCGTTLVTAKNMGFRGIGFDRHQVFFNLAKAKLGNYSLRDLEKIRSNLNDSNSGVEWSEHASIFLEKMFDKSELGAINLASGAAGEMEERLRPLAIAFFLKACEASCGGQTDGIYKAPSSTKKTIPFKRAMDVAYDIFKDDIEAEWYSSHWVSQPEPICINKSSTNMSEIDSDTVGICITSPPYLNNFDYAEMTRMHLYLLGWVGSWGEISTSIRNDLITNTTTALKGKKTDEYQLASRSELPDALLVELDAIVIELQGERKIRAGKKEYDYLVYPYYAQITRVLAGLYRVLKPGGVVHWVVADAALYGIHLKTHIHTAEIMKSLGFVNVTVEFMRRRGHRWVLDKRDGAKEGLGEYHLTAYKETRP